MTNENLSEKVSVNINTATLSEIDLLVDNGYYSNRSDFINHALRTALESQRATVERLIEKNTKSTNKEHGWFLGIYGITAKELEEMHAEGQRMTLTGYGLLKIAENCDEEMLFEVVESIRVRGKVIATDSVRAHYGLK